MVDLNGNGLRRVLTLADDGLIFKTASNTHTAVTTVQEPLEIASQFKPGAIPVGHPHQQSSGTSNASSLLRWRSCKTHEQSQIPWDPIRKNADVQNRSNEQNSGARKDSSR